MSNTNNTETAHTPTPWQVTELDSGLQVKRLMPYGDHTAATVVYGQSFHPDFPAIARHSIANADFIVRAVNAHDELMRIAEAYRNLLRTAAHTEGEVATFNHIEGVLKIARGEA